MDVKVDGRGEGKVCKGHVILGLVGRGSRPSKSSSDSDSPYHLHPNDPSKLRRSKRGLLLARCEYPTSLNVFQRLPMCTEPGRVHMPVGARVRSDLTVRAVFGFFVPSFSPHLNTPTMAYQRLALDEFPKLRSSATGQSTAHPQCRYSRCPTEISSTALGGKVTSVSDEFFAEAFHLLLVEASALLIFDLLDSPLCRFLCIACTEPQGSLRS